MTADVLATNQAMLKVFEQSGFTARRHYEDGAYTVTIDLYPEEER